MTIHTNPLHRASSHAVDRAPGVVPSSHAPGATNPDTAERTAKAIRDLPPSRPVRSQPVGGDGKATAGDTTKDRGRPLANRDQVRLATTSKRTQKQLAEIGRMIRAGMTYSQIGKVLGKSRNAIAGIVNRNPHLRKREDAPELVPAKGNRKPHMPKGEDAPSSVSVKANRKRGGDFGGKPGKALLEARAKARKAESRKLAPGYVERPEPSIPVEPLMLSLVDLTDRTCKWPIGDPKQQGFGFCGHETRHGSSWCDHHHGIVFTCQRGGEAA